MNSLPISPERAEKLVDYIQSIWNAAGRPSSRALAKCAHVSHTTVNDVINGHRIGGWSTVTAVVNALDGDMNVVREILGDEFTTKVKHRSVVVMLGEIKDELAQIRTLLENR